MRWNEEMRWYKRDGMVGERWDGRREGGEMLEKRWDGRREMGW